MDQRAFFAATVMAITATQFALADSPHATAVLSSSEAMVGQMVQMEVKVSNANNVEAPSEISVEGLDIHQTGTSRQFEMRNFTTTSSITYNYTILPLKAGTFKIPGQTVRVGGSSLQTPELTLRVSASTGGQSLPNTAGATSPNSGRLAFAE